MLGTIAIFRVKRLYAPYPCRSRRQRLAIAKIPPSPIKRPRKARWVFDDEGRIIRKRQLYRFVGIKCFE